MILVEHVKDDIDHSEINAANIAIILKEFPNEIIHFFSGEKHYKTICTILKKHNVSLENLIHHNIIPYNTFVRDYNMIFSDLKIIKKIYNFAQLHKQRKIIFFYTSTFLLFYLKIYCCFYNKIEVTACIHGDLERIDLIQYAKSFKKNQIIMFLYALIFGLRIPLETPTPKNLKYITWGESIKENTLKIIPKISSSLKVIQHPYLFNMDYENLLSNNFDIINFTVVGLTSPRKNQPYLKNLINCLKNIQTNNFRIMFAGKVLDKDFINELQLIDFVYKKTLSNKPISQDLRNETLNKATYTLLTYNLNSYKLIASGAFMDCINYEKPIITIKNDFVEYYFKKYGNIGYMLNSYEELESLVISIIKDFSITKYIEQVNNIKKIKQKENIILNSEKFKNIF